MPPQPVWRHAPGDHESLQELSSVRLHRYADLLRQRRDRQESDLRTTQQAFGDKLHTYTIVDAINDGNVLPFRIDYVNTVKEKDDVKDSQVRAIDIEKAMGAPERIREIVRYTLEHFDQKRSATALYTLKGQRMAGFNSIFAVSSIPMAMKYYTEFKRQLAEQHRDLTIATIFSFAANEDDPEDALPEEGFETDALDQTARGIFWTPPFRTITRRSMSILTRRRTSSRTTTKTCPSASRRGRSICSSWSICS